MFASKLVIGLTCLAMLSQTALAVLGVDISDAFSDFTCLANQGYQFAIVRGYCSYGGVDANAPQNLKNAKAAGLIADVYLFPCAGLDPADQANAMIGYLASKSADIYGTIWIDVETNPSPNCGWG
jgi:hypothetical protein